MEPEVNYCPRCGTRVALAETFGRQRAVCPHCGWIHFNDPKVAAAILIEEDDRVLLVRRVNEPNVHGMRPAWMSKSRAVHGRIRTYNAYGSG